MKTYDREVELDDFSGRIEIEIEIENVGEEASDFMDEAVRIIKSSLRDEKGAVDAMDSHLLGISERCNIKTLGTASADVQLPDGPTLFITLTAKLKKNAKPRDIQPLLDAGAADAAKAIEAWAEQSALVGRPAW